VEVSLLESAIDMQFELLTTFLNDGGLLPRRSATNNANAYLAAPYGVYRTADGYMALAMAAVPRLGELLSLPALCDYRSPQSWFDHRDQIKTILASHLATQSSRFWLSILEPADIWCAEVLDWRQLVRHEAVHVARLTQTVGHATARELLTTRCPIRIDGEILTHPAAAPRVGEHSDEIRQRFDLELHDPSETVAPLLGGPMK
jgi:crotonobetainyl-CoA:carnitine CoA-transferase CaiB-like acyl-CoA transferase